MPIIKIKTQISEIKAVLLCFGGGTFDFKIAKREACFTTISPFSLRNIHNSGIFDRV